MKFILGNCALQSSELYFYTAEYLSNVMNNLNIKDWYLKISWDKANRSSLSGKRGKYNFDPNQSIDYPSKENLKFGIECFYEVKKRFPNLKLTTDFHESWQAKELSGCIDLIQVASYLSRQTDMLTYAAFYFDKVNIKKAQFASPTQASKWIDKIKTIKPSCEAWITERGTCLGYDRLVADFSGVDFLKQTYNIACNDCTHETQFTRSGYTGGSREIAKRYFLATPIFKYDATFAEVYPFKKTKQFGDPISDGDCMIDIDDVESLIIKQREIQRIIQ